jgi:UDP-N-acetylglucosamine 2-epimerase (non-hydrolysing)
MLDQILSAFDIVPDFDLKVMEPDQSLAGLSARCLSRLDDYFAERRPDLVIVQGDTTTAFCAALCAFYRKIPVAHVEAGLRTGNLQSPWPEEANRTLISRLCFLHFCPTSTSRQNLLAEGIAPAGIHVTGNTVIDALFIALARVRNAPPEVPGLPENWREAWEGTPVVVITGHRRENFGKGFESICAAISTLAHRFPGVKFVYPVHLNPNVQGPVYHTLQGRDARHRNIFLLEPLSYLPFVDLLSRATVVLTDSGGIQEEAPSLGKPVLVMRDTTERPEAVEAGTVKLVGTDSSTIVRETACLLTDPSAFHEMARAHNPYGDGRATERIVHRIAERLIDRMADA